MKTTIVCRHTPPPGTRVSPDFLGVAAHHRRDRLGHITDTAPSNWTCRYLRSWPRLCVAQRRPVIRRGAWCTHILSGSFLHMSTDYDLSSDVVWGAEAIGEFLGMTRRQVYHAAYQEHLPIFRIGSTLACRKSTLMAFITEREEKNASFRRGLPRI
jgi:hypothetical protein